MDSTRQQKVNKVLQKELADFFLFKGKSIYGKTMITVTRVTITQDLSIARVYLSIFNSEQAKEAVVKQVQEHAKTIRHEIAQNIKKQMRIIPFLEFYHDDSLDYIDNIEKLLKG